MNLQSGTEELNEFDRITHMLQRRSQIEASRQKTRLPQGRFAKQRSNQSPSRHLLSLAAGAHLPPQANKEGTSLSKLRPKPIRAGKAEQPQKPFKFLFSRDPSELQEQPAQGRRSMEDSHGLHQAEGDLHPLLGRNQDMDVDSVEPTSALSDYKFVQKSSIEIDRESESQQPTSEGQRRSDVQSIGALYTDSCPSPGVYDSTSQSSERESNNGLAGGQTQTEPSKFGKSAFARFQQEETSMSSEESQSHMSCQESDSDEPMEDQSPLGEEVLFMRFAGNIAESDEDYDEEIASLGSCPIDSSRLADRITQFQLQEDGALQDPSTRAMKQSPYFEGEKQSVSFEKSFGIQDFSVSPIDQQRCFDDNSRSIHGYVRRKRAESYDGAGSSSEDNMGLDDTQQGISMNAQHQFQDSELLPDLDLSDMDSFSDGEEVRPNLSQTNSKSLEQCVNRYRLNEVFGDGCRSQKRTPLSQRPEVILDSKTTIGNKVRNSGLSSYIEDTGFHFQDRKNSVPEAQGQLNISAPAVQLHPMSQKSSFSNLHSALSNDLASPNQKQPFSKKSSGKRTQEERQFGLTKITRDNFHSSSKLLPGSMKQDLDQGVQPKKTPPSQFSRPFKIDQDLDEESPRNGRPSNNGILAIHACRPATMFHQEPSHPASREGAGPPKQLGILSKASLSTAAPPTAGATPKFAGDGAALMGPRVEQTSIIESSMPAKQQSKVQMAKIQQLQKIYSPADSAYTMPARLRKPLKEKEPIFYPELIEKTPAFQEKFLKDFSTVVEKDLKKKMELVPKPDLEALQDRFRKQAGDTRKTLVVTLEECLLQSNLYKEQLPVVHGEIKYQKFSLYLCFRKHMQTFLQEAAKHYEVIAWTSNQEDYGQLLAAEVEAQLAPFKFDHVLSLEQQTQTKDKKISVKSLEVLAGGRREEDIIMIDPNMSNFTFSLTNGIFVPSFQLHSYADDEVLLSLGHYLQCFVGTQKQRKSTEQAPSQIEEEAVADVRQKIKSDFDLLTKFNGFKQNQAFQKIAQRTKDAMDSDLGEPISQQRSPQSELRTMDTWGKKCLWERGTRTEEKKGRKAWEQAK